MKKKKKTRPGYYRPQNVNPNWYEIWAEQIKEGVPAKEMLDELCKIACGAELGASDGVQSFATHIHACLIAAYKAGKAERKVEDGR